MVHMVTLMLCTFNHNCLKEREKKKGEKEEKGEMKEKKEVEKMDTCK